MGQLDLALANDVEVVWSHRLPRLDIHLAERAVDRRHVMLRHAGEHWHLAQEAEARGAGGTVEDTTEHLSVHSPHLPRADRLHRRRARGAIHQRQFTEARGVAKHGDDDALRARRHLPIRDFRRHLAREPSLGFRASLDLVHHQLGHLVLARLDHVEVVALIALANHLRACRYLVRFERRHNVREQLGLKVGEDGGLLEAFPDESLVLGCLFVNLVHVLALAVVHVPRRHRPAAVATRHRGCGAGHLGQRH
mmetsp:Transcript_5084/g.9663  ORF Transcript_5084/g.9663 Transcript_5084/m.9663 type:complete len:251 (-) Transcript_5084:176-928(-)